MNKVLFKCALLGGMLIAFSFSASGQTSDDGTATKILNGTAKTTYVIVGTTSKLAWKTTKFTAKHVAKPIFVKAAPAAGKYIVKRSFPVVKKLAITYLKL